MIDSYRHKGLRLKLVEDVKRKGIHNEKILDALYALPRHWFMDSSFLEFAYEDKAFPIGSGQTISQPYTVAFQTQLLEIEKGDKVLEIGTGSGYQACILSELGAKVFTIERQRNLYFRTKPFLSQIGYEKIKCFFGDGNLGLPLFAPFNKILVTCAAEIIPSALIEQLKVGGILVVPVGGSNGQTMMQIKKIGPDKLEQTPFGKFRFVPLLKNKGED